MSTNKTSNPNPNLPADPEARILARTSVRPGETFGRYQLLVPVAAGGMGTVWAARQVGHHQFKRIVGVKVAHDSFTGDEEHRRMFLDEARIAYAIQHSNVCSVLDVGEENGRLFLVMEWMAGSVRELLARVPNRILPLAIAARIIADACAGLHAAHELRDENGEMMELIHRDMSPDNILLTLDGQVKVADFGIARARDRMQRGTETGQLKGKLMFMAAEQISTKTYDRRVDIFALGVILYRATLGCKAFDGPDATIIYDILEGRFKAPREVEPALDPGFEAIILRAMAHDPNDRYPTALALKDALEDWLRQHGGATTEDVGAIVRAALGAGLAKRTERIRIAVAALDAAENAIKVSDATEDEETNLSKDVRSAASSVKRPASHSVNINISGSEDSDQKASAGVSLTPPRVSEVPPAPSKKSRSMWIAGAVSLSLVAIGVSAASRLSPNQPASSVPDLAVTAPISGSATTSLTTTSTLPAVPTVTPSASVAFSVRAIPSSAVLVMDHTTRLPLPVETEFPRDGSRHHLSVEAPGFRPEVHTVTFDEATNLSVVLHPVLAAPAGKAGPRGPAHVATQAPSTEATATAASTTAGSAPNVTPVPSNNPTSGKKKHNIDRELGD